MPAPPEISQRGGKIRLAEVGHHLNAEQLRDTQHHVDAAGKIRILLQRIEQDRQQCHRPGEGGIVPVKDRGNRWCSQVGNGVFFHRTEQDHKEGAFGALPLPGMRGGQLGLHCSVPVDGALDQLWEKRNKQQKPSRVLFSRVAAAEAVDQITDRLKGVKADAERHDQPQRRGCGGCHRTGQQARKI